MYYKTLQKNVLDNLQRNLDKLACHRYTNINKDYLKEASILRKLDNLKSYIVQGPGWQRICSVPTFWQPVLWREASNPELRTNRSCLNQRTLLIGSLLNDLLVVVRVWQVIGVLKLGVISTCIIKCVWLSAGRSVRMCVSVCARVCACVRVCMMKYGMDDLIWNFISQAN